MKSYIKLLEQLNQNSLNEAGGKGANLGILINEGLPVPPGFVVTASAYRAHLEDAGLPERIENRLNCIGSQDLEEITKVSGDIAKWIEEASMPTAIREEVLAAYKNLSEGMGYIESGISKLQVAVRSSATAEDLPSASFAGQQETFLGISGEEAVLKHVKKCWASLWTSQAVSYRTSMGFEHLKVDLAVVVQAMIPSDAAGVMFTANPVSGSMDEILISASYGLGESVVSGAVTPDTFILDVNGGIKQRTLGSKESCILLVESGTKTEVVSTADQKRYCLTDTNLADLVSLAKRVQTHYGSPQDTEWALSKGKMYLLQARPITTMIVNTAEDPKVLESGEEILWQGKKPPFGITGLMEHFVEPLTPLAMDLHCAGDRSFQAFFNKIGMGMSKKPTAPFERPNGCVALQMEQSRLSPALLWKLPAHLIEKSRIDPKDQWQPLFDEMNSWLKRMKETERGINNPVSLATLIEQSFIEVEELMTKRFYAVFFASMISEGKIMSFIKKAADKEEAPALKDRLFRALPFRTELQNQAMVRLAQTAATFGKDSDQYKAAFKGFLEEYGDRPALGMIPALSTPSLRERPDSVQGLVDALLSDPESLNWKEAQHKQEADYKEARQRVEAALSPRKKRKFVHHLDRARGGIIIREESLFMIEKIFAFMRHLVFRLGELFVQNRIIDEAEDILYLFLHELKDTAEGAVSVLERVSKRKQGFAKVYAAHEKGQHWMITTGTIPSLESFEKNKKKKSDNVEDKSLLKGLAASRGTYEGTVCIVKGPHEFNKLHKGDILVAPFTAPVWTPLFRVASAVVTEIGSPVSHAAIVAREYGIPAVVAVSDITSILKDGQRIYVDGTKGEIKIIR